MRIKGNCHIETRISFVLVGNFVLIGRFHFDFHVARAEMLKPCVESPNFLGAVWGGGVAEAGERWRRLSAGEEGMTSTPRARARSAQCTSGR